MSAELDQVADDNDWIGGGTPAAPAPEATAEPPLPEPKGEDENEPVEPPEPIPFPRGNRPAFAPEPESTFDRLPPHDLDAERAVLGSVLIDPAAVIDALELLAPADFSRQAHSLIFAAMASLYGEGQAPDVVTVAAQLERTGDLEAAGGAAYLSILGNDTPTAVYVGQYARIVAARSRERATIRAAGRIAALAYERDPDLAERVTKILAAVPVAQPAGAPIAWPLPEDRGSAVLSDLGETEYVDDVVRPGRVILVAGEEGTGKSYTADNELAMRIAVVGGSFAETWPVLRTGAVLVLSEMHGDDDFGRETTVLASLGLDRSALSGRYFRLPLMTAAGGKPALTVPEWREWITGWLRDHEVLLLVVDTATGATQVDPWGGAIQAVYQDLRGMLAAYPALAVVLLVHLKKPSGRGDRRLSDVLGEWGRWCDVVLLMENDGGSLDRVRLTLRKRVRHERRIVATKRGGLLVEAADADRGKTTKVSLEDIISYVVAHPGSSYADIAKAFEVTKDTASNYVKAAGLPSRTVGPRRQTLVYPPEPTAEPPNTTEQTRFGGHSVVEGTERETTAEPPNEPYRGSVVGSSVVPPSIVQCSDYHAHQLRHVRDGDDWRCPVCDPEGTP